MTRVVCAGAIAAMLLGGCRSWEPIRPDQLPQLNGAFAQTVGYTHSGRMTSGGYNTTSHPVVAYSVRHVSRPDGTMAEINGPFHVRLTRRSGEELFFEHPVLANLEAPELLVVQAGNMPPTPTLLSDISLLAAR